ncbi:hypothetical protein EYF80_034043 [Liparis tanakae]|uniref:Uncharacterized protein n=1 Tax=Liparis tanakae TaxID=230148 RepID=A0A4Z2GSI9_9TELE|nr:hypothetical protein EYF80_034043 [Liparis tanakae]
MHEQCLMLRPRTQTSSPPAGRDAGTPCTTSCRAPPTPRDGGSPCRCPSCTSTREGEMETTPRTARAPPHPPTGRWGRGTANQPRSPGSGRGAAGRIPAAVVMEVQRGLLAGG